MNWDITIKQKRVLEALLHLQVTLERAPTIVEIASELKIHSPSTIHKHLQRLIEAGLVRKNRIGCGFVADRPADKFRTAIIEGASMRARETCRKMGLTIHQEEQIVRAIREG